MPDVPLHDCESQMDPTIKAMAEQSFVDGRERLKLIGEEGARGGQMLSERAREQFVLSSQLVGAAAAARLDRDQLAHQILQQNAAAAQPAKAPSAAG